MQTLFRFVLGGAIVAALPFIAERFGPAASGLAVLFPVATFAGYLFLGSSPWSRRRGGGIVQLVLGSSDRP